MKYPDTFEDIWKTVQPFTMVGKNRAFGLYEAVNHVLDHRISGDFVQCGVWRGGSAMLIALVLKARGVTKRRIMLFDTFTGMTPPTEADRDLNDIPARELMDKAEPGSLMMADCDLKTVRANMISTGYDRKMFGYIEGDVCDTLPFDGIRNIALLYLDTDFHDSTAAELEHLYPLVRPGGVVIIDDYGHWQGARTAFDAFLKSERAGGQVHFPVPLDYTGRLFIKPAPQAGIGAMPPVSKTKPPARPRPQEPAKPDIARYDYLSETLQDPGLLSRFTHLMRGKPMEVAWPYLRSDVPHVWRTDARSPKPNIGVLSVDEGALLYNAALPFCGKRGLEIGCHTGFSTAHLAAAGLRLDVIDPVLGNPAGLATVQESLNRAVPGHEVRLHAGFSPGIVALVHGAKPRTPWSFAFIDGLHDGEAPVSDARAVEPFMAKTAAVMFHDLTCPDVAMGLRHYRDAGWQTRIYDTMQVMGLAWRGDYTPPDHVPDPVASSATLDHLSVWRRDGMVGS